MRIFSSYSVRSRLAAGRPSDRDRAVVVVPVFRRRGGELVEDPIEPLIERQFDRDGIDHRRRLGERDVRGAERLGAAPKGDQAGRVDIVPDIEPPVGLDEVVLEVLGRRAGIEAETAAGQQPQRCGSSHSDRSSSDGRTTASAEPTGAVVVANTLSSYPRLRSTGGYSVNAPTLMPSSSPRWTAPPADDVASGRSTCGVCWSRVCLGRRRRVDLGLDSRCRARQQRPAKDGSPNEPSARRTNRHGTSRPPRQRCKRRLNEALPQTTDARFCWLCWCRLI